MPPQPPAATPVLATRLIRAIFGCYFVVAAALTAVQLAVEYGDAHDHLQRDVAALERTFGPGLEDAVWRFNGEVLRGILAGMREIPAVVGVEVRDEKGRRVEAVGAVAEADSGAASPTRVGGLGTRFSRRFDLVHVDETGRRYPVGSWTVFSDTGIAIEQVRRTLVVILINSAIKTVMLWFIFVAVIRWMVGRPLAQVAAHLARMDRETLAEPLVLRGGGRHELHALVAALNATTDRLRRAFEERNALTHDLTEMNATLQARVAARTRELEALAATDQLTGLPNRRRLDAALDEALAAEAGSGLAVIVCDVDQFKAVNDQHGHTVGDAVLGGIAGILAQAQGPGDTVGRWGGEEFMLVCPGADLAAARARAEALRVRIEASALPFVGPRTCSFGVAARRAGEAVDGLVARADAALYRAKRNGRNRVEIEESIEARDAA